MKKLLSGLFSGLIMLGVAGVIHATPLLDISGGFPGFVPLNSTHDVAETSGAAGRYNANLYALENVSLTYEYLGFEAGWTNSFNVDGSLAFLNKNFGGNSASTSGDTVSSSAASGSLLNFAFNILAGGNAGYGVENGSNVMPFGVPNNPVNNYSAPNFFLGYVDASQQSVYIALDDGGGRPWHRNSLADDDHDDLVIKVTATAAPVPEPSTLLLFGSGLAGLTSFYRRKKK